MAAPDYQQLFQHCPGRFLVLTPDLIIVDATEGYLDATMTTRAGIVGRPVFEAFPDNPDDPEATGVRNLAASFARVLRTRQTDRMPIQKYDIRRPGSHGGSFQARWWSPTNTPVIDERGEVRWLIHRVEDVTEIVRLRAQEQAAVDANAALRQDALEVAADHARHLAELNAELQRSNAELGQFAAVASHDLQEPLRMVASYLTLLQRRAGAKLDERESGYIAHAVGGAERMSRLISNLLEYARVQRSAVAMLPIDSSTALAQALHDLQPRIAASAGMVTCGPLPRVAADHALLVRLFLNLIGNALKYHRDNVPPRVHVDAEDRGDAWAFLIRDNGLGIPAGERERVFELFTRGQAGSGTQGTGLGLAICKRIVERHRGRIWVESEVGAGSTFGFTLPKRVGSA